MAEDLDFAPLPPRPQNWDELFATTGGLKGIPIAEIVQGRVDWEYDFDSKDMRPCGRDRCERKHAHGWLVALPGRRFVHIGKDCAKKYANGELWQSNVSAYRERVAAEYRTTALLEARDQAQRKQHWLDNTPEIQSAIALYDSFVQQARGPFLSEIEKRADRGNAVIEVDVRLTEQQLETRRAMLSSQVRGDGKTVSTYVAPIEKMVVGEISGLDCFRPMRNPKDLQAQLQRLVKTLLSWVPAEGDIDSARSLSIATRELGPLGNQLNASLVDIKKFFSQTNLNALMKLPVAKSQGFLSIEFDGKDIVRMTRRPHWDRAA